MSVFATGWRMLPCPDVLSNALKARGAIVVKLYDFGDTHIIYTVEPFGPAGNELGIHMSISAPDRHPTWEEQREAVWHLCPGVRMASYIPPKSQYGTLPDSHVFHWFEVMDRDDYTSHLGDWL